MTRLSPADLDGVRARHDLAAQAGRRVALRKAGAKLIGPCPICSPDPRSKTASRFEVKGERWVCAVCQDGGDVIGLVMKSEGLDFRVALDMLGEGELLGRAMTPEERRAAEVKASAERGIRAREQAEAERALAEKREKKRAAYEQIFMLAAPLARDCEESAIVLAYLEVRGIPREVAIDTKLRASRMNYWGEAADRKALHPVMLAPFRDLSGRFTGLHLTWLCEAAGKVSKARITGADGEALNAKTMHGQKLGSFIPLLDHRGEDFGAARYLAMAEGIETALSLPAAMARLKDLRWRNMHLVATGDLGNLAGKALGRVAHPSLTRPDGSAVMVPDARPDPASPAAPVPENVTRLLILADGAGKTDAERFAGDLAARRAGLRHARPGRHVSLALPEGKRDLNDVLEGR
jgi:hypothetical protein